MMEKETGMDGVGIDGAAPSEHPTNATNEYLRLWVRLRPVTGNTPQRHARDPRTHGLCSTVIRRALGNTLVKMFCPYGTPRCQPRGGNDGLQVIDLCQLAAHCPYGVLYARSLNPRPPVALHVPRRFRRGEAGVELTFFGANRGASHLNRGASHLNTGVPATLTGVPATLTGRPPHRWPP